MSAWFVGSENPKRVGAGFEPDTKGPQGRQGLYLLFYWKLETMVVYSVLCLCPLTFSCFP